MRLLAEATLVIEPAAQLKLSPSHTAPLVPAAEVRYLPTIPPLRQQPTFTSTLFIAIVQPASFFPQLLPQFPRTQQPITQLCTRLKQPCLLRCRYLTLVPAFLNNQLHFDFPHSAFLQTSLTTTAISAKTASFEDARSTRIPNTLTKSIIIMSDAKLQKILLQSNDGVTIEVGKYPAYHQRLCFAFRTIGC